MAMDPKQLHALSDADAKRLLLALEERGKSDLSDWVELVGADLELWPRPDLGAGRENHVRLLAEAHPYAEAHP